MGGLLAGKTIGTIFRRIGVRGQGGVEYLILIAALIGLGILVAYYWWSFASTAGESAAPPGATKSASEAAMKASSSNTQSYSSRIS